MIIPENNLNETNNSVNEKVRVALYSRTESAYTPIDYQLSSLKNVVTQNPEWELVATYADEGVSAKSAKSSTVFNQMIEDAKNGNFDLIVTYDIYHFARNENEAVLITRKLNSMGIGVIFAKENINSLDPDDKFILAIISYITQEESRRHSERVKMGIRIAKERKAKLSNEKNKTI